MLQDEVRVDFKSLKAFTREVFVKVGMPPEDVEIEADSR